MNKFKSRLLRWLYPLARLYWFLIRPKGIGIKVVITFKDEILLVQHSYGFRMLWVLPGGGLKKKETPEAAALREVKEEVGLNLKNIKNYGEILNVGEYKSINLWVLGGDVDDKEFSTDNFEIKNARWFKLDKLPFILSPITIKCLEMVKKID